MLRRRQIWPQRVHRPIVSVWITHMQEIIQFLGLRSAPCLLQKGTSQLAHRHPSVELRGIESKRDGAPLPTQHAGRVTLPGGGEWGERNALRNKSVITNLFSARAAKNRCSSDRKKKGSRMPKHLCFMLRVPRKRSQTTWWAATTTTTTKCIRRVKVALKLPAGTHWFRPLSFN